MTDESASAEPRAQASEAAPISLWAMAFLALLPFPVAASVFVYGSDDASRQGLSVLLTWSAVVLAFLAGVRWGLESSRRVPRFSRLASAVVFGAAAWGLLVARWRIELAWTLAAYLCAFMLQWVSDHTTPNTAARFPRLSTTITAAACVSLALALDHVLRG